MRSRSGLSGNVKLGLDMSSVVAGIRVHHEIISDDESKPAPVAPYGVADSEDMARYAPPSTGSGILLGDVMAFKGLDIRI